VFGGKITTYRHLAEAAVDQLAARLPALHAPSWTDQQPLPGGDFPTDGAPALAARLTARYAFLSDETARRLVRAYGTDSFAILGDAADLADCGRQFGHGLTERELRHLIDREWARTTEDILWRRTKLGLRFTPAERQALADWLAQNGAGEQGA